MVNQNKESGQKRKTAIDLYGKLPPQAIELEEALLGACTLEKDAFAKVADILKIGSFYKDVNNRVFSAMKTLYQRMQPIDILTVTEQLRASGELENVGGPYYIAKLQDKVMSAQNIEAHARIIQAHWFRREVIRISGELIGYAYRDSTEDITALTDAASEAFYAMQAEMVGSNLQSFEQLMSKEVESLDDENKKEGITGVPTGFRSVDKPTAGWQPADLILLASRPSMGKTALAAKMAYRSAKLYDVPTLFFSLEMTADKINKRIISSETEILMSKSLHNWYDSHEKDRIRQFADQSGPVRFWIDDNASHSLSTLSAVARKEKNKHNIGIIFIDYIQLLSVADEQFRKSGTRDQDLGLISRGLKRLAKELKVPVIALCQLSRAAEQGDQKRMPQLKHLRESGNLEQDADIVMFLYREAYYLEREQPGLFLDPVIQKDAQLSIAKHRNGPLDTINLIYEAPYTSFKDPEDVYESSF